MSVNSKKTQSSKEMKSLLSELNKKFGNNAITLGFPKTLEGNPEEIARIQTGSFSLDLALGGGIPVGRFTEISGAYSSTKTTQCLHIIRKAQEEDYVCALIDVEGTTDEPFIKSIGIDSDALFYSRPDGMEEACQIILDLQRSGEVHLAVLDSIAAMSPNKEQSTTMDESFRMGIPQQILGEFFRKYQANNNRLTREGKTPFTLIGVNQLREKIGGYGDPEFSPGGRAKGFAASVDLRLRRGDWIAEGSGENKEFVGQVVKFKIEKNKTFKRMQTGEFDFYFAENDTGIPVFYNDEHKEVIMAAVEWGLIEKAGAWFNYDGNKYQGLSKLLEAMVEDEELVREMKKKIITLAYRKHD